MNPTARRGVLLPTLLLPVVATCCCGHPSRATLRVATLNLAHARGLTLNPLGQIGLPRRTFEENLAAVAETLQGEAPDVVALQEADAASDWSGGFDHVGFLSHAAGYPHHHHGLHTDLDRAGLELRYGTALLARRELANARSVAFDREPMDSTKGYVVAEIEFAGRTVVIVSVHLHSKFAAARQRQARALVEQLRRYDAALIVMGDFNTTWERTDGALRLIARELDLLPYEPENDQRNTFPSLGPRRRIDWILISKRLRFRDCRRWPDKLSDHLGVSAELAWR